MPDVEVLVLQLAEAKEAEEAAKQRRLAAEDALAKAIGVPESWSGSVTSVIGTYKVTCSRKDNIRIDVDKLAEAVNKSTELTGWSKRVFRWKPEIAKKEWDKAPADVVKVFSTAITRTPGKISFTLKNKEDK